MIDFDAVEARIEALARDFSSAKPYPHVVIDNFCFDGELRQMCASLRSPAELGASKSRDYVFARNKFEKSALGELSPQAARLRDELLSPRFAELLRKITGEEVFVDPAFHGGGLHQGGARSFLDLHVDFNYHPLNPAWFRNLNILIYLNDGWQKAYGGELKMRHLDHPGDTRLIEPLFNRCVIMFTRSYTLHGYDAIRFPQGVYRRSIAAYAYSQAGEQGRGARSTVWYPEDINPLKRVLGRAWPLLVSLKGRLLGSGTAKNR
jgi:hypothetical protein